MRKRHEVAALTPRRIQEELNGRLITIEDFLQNFGDYEEDQRIAKLQYIFTARTSLKDREVLYGWAEAFDP